MPTSTTRYRFEFRLNDWAEKFVTSLAGRRSAFFIGFREDETVRRVYVALPEEPFDSAQKIQLTEAYPRWFLYVPYDDDGTAYLEWLGIHRRIPERWIGRRLEPADFLDVRTTSSRDGWPESWRVIVA